MSGQALQKSFDSLFDVVEKDLNEHWGVLFDLLYHDTENFDTVVQKQSLYQLYSCLYEIVPFI